MRARHAADRVRVNRWRGPRKIGTGHSGDQRGGCFACKEQGKYRPQRRCVWKNPQTAEQMHLGEGRSSPLPLRERSAAPSGQVGYIRLGPPHDSAELGYTPGQSRITAGSSFPPPPPLPLRPPPPGGGGGRNRAPPPHRNLT